MFLCKFVHFLFSAFPLKSWQDFLIRTHLYTCTACRNRLASHEEVKAVTFQEGDISSSKDLWAEVETAIKKERTEKHAAFRLSWKWVFAGASLVAILIGGFLIFNILIRNGGNLEEDAMRFQINYIRVGSEAATPFLYQPKDTDMIIVWAEKNS